MAKKLSFRVEGTTCASCEVLIEREVKKIPGVLATDVSHPKRRLVITVEDRACVTPAQIEKLVKQHGYRFFEDAQHAQERERVSWQRVGAALIVVVGLYLLLKQIGFLSFSPSTEGISGFGSVFLIGVIAAFSSCAAVVAGLVVAVSAKASEEGTALTVTEKMRPHFLFHAGRVIGFGAFGALIGLLGQAFALSATANGVLVIALALFMIALGVNLMHILPTNMVSVRPPKWLAHRVHDLTHSDRKDVPFVLGALTFFLPCGFTQAMQIFALSTGDPKTAALVMMVFALGTMPMLLALGYGASSAKGATLKKFTQVAGAFVIVLGISNVTNGATLLGLNVFSGSGQPAVEAARTSDGDEQVIRMNVMSYGGYEPSVLMVQRGVPVRWEVIGSDFMGCADSLVLRTFGVNKRLKEGLNVIEFTPSKAGTFTFSCSMGMIRGTMKVIE